MPWTHLVRRMRLEPHCNSCAPSSQRVRDYADDSTTRGTTRRDPTEKESAMGIHWTELLIISMVALLIFGPKRLPEMGSAIGKTYKEFKKSLSEVAASATTEVAT